MREDELFGIIGNKLYLKKDFEFTWLKKTYIIPEGFVFDGASIPRIFWSLIGYPLEDDFRVSSLIHDWCYRTNCLTFNASNTLFHRRLKTYGVHWFKRSLMYSAVNLGGYPTYSRVNKESLEQIRQCLVDHPLKSMIEKQIKVSYYHEDYKWFPDNT